MMFLICSPVSCDPFGMDLGTSLKAFSGWLEGIENELELNSFSFGIEQFEVGKGEDPLFARMDLVWNGPVKFHPEIDDFEMEEASLLFDKQLGAELCDGDLLSDGKLKEIMRFRFDKYWVAGDTDVEIQGYNETYSDGDEGPPHDALSFAFGYLDVKDLISIEMVCKSFCDAVRNDPLLWKSIRIDHPISQRITDDALLQLTNKAQGALECLSVVECIRITDIGINQVLETNPRLTKLSVPGCLGLSVEGILSNFKALRSAGKLGLKLLRISGLDGMTKMQFEELKSLLGADNYSHLTAHKPRFFGSGQLYLSCEDDRVIDIESCPR